MTASGLRPLLHQLVADVERLLMAGSATAAADERLRQHRDALGPWLDAVPALRPVGDALERVVVSAAAEPRAEFLSLFTLVRQVRSALLSHGLEGRAEPLAAGGPWTTPLDAAAVRQTVRSLTITPTGSRPLPPAADRHPGDLRLIDPWLSHVFRSPGRHTATFFRGVLPAHGRALRAEFRRRLTTEKDPGHHGKLFHALCNLDPEAAPELCRAALQGGSASLRVQALRRLGQFAPAEAETAARRLLGPPSPVPLRVAAASVLHRLRPPRGELLGLLSQHVQDADAWKVCLGAIRVFVALGEGGRRLAFDVLLPALKKGASGRKRSGLVEALGRLGPVARPALPLLLRLLRATGFDRCDDAVVLNALASIGADTPEVVEALLSLAPRPSAGVPLYRQQMVLDRIGEQLVRLAERDAVVTELVAEACRQADWPPLRTRLFDVLARLEGRAGGATPVLTQMARSGAPDVRLAAVRTLGRIGGPAAEAAPSLLTFLRGGSRALRHRTAVALARMGQCSDRIVSLLVGGMWDGRISVDDRCEAVQAVPFLGERGKELVPVLRAVVEGAQASPRLRFAAQQALRQLGQGEPAAAPGPFAR